MRKSQPEIQYLTSEEDGVQDVGRWGRGYSPPMGSIKRNVRAGSDIMVGKTECWETVIDNHLNSFNDRLRPRLRDDIRNGKNLPCVRARPGQHAAMLLVRANCI